MKYKMSLQNCNSLGQEKTSLWSSGSLTGANARSDGEAREGAGRPGSGVAAESRAVVGDRPFDRVEDAVDLAGADGAHQRETADLLSGKGFLEAWNEPDEARPAGHHIIYQGDGSGGSPLLPRHPDRIVVLIRSGPMTGPGGLPVSDGG